MQFTVVEFIEKATSRTEVALDFFAEPKAL